MKKIFTVAFMRDLEKKINKGEISYSRMVEILNEKAWEGYSDNIESQVGFIQFNGNLEDLAKEGYSLGGFEESDLYKNAPIMGISQVEMALKSIGDRNPKNEDSKWDLDPEKD